jgi:hypothetical protein
MTFVPARQPPQNQDEAAATGTDSAENGARSGAIAVQAVLVANRADADDAAQDISAPPTESGSGNDDCAVVSPVQDSQDCRCHRCCCHCHRQRGPCHHCLHRCRHLCHQRFCCRCQIDSAIICVIATTIAVAATATVVAYVVAALLSLLSPPLPLQPLSLLLLLLLLPPLPQMPPPQQPSLLQWSLLPLLLLPPPPLSLQPPPPPPLPLPLPSPLQLSLLHARTATHNGESN